MNERIRMNPLQIIADAVNSHQAVMFSIGSLLLCLLIREKSSAIMKQGIYN